MKNKHNRSSKTAHIGAPALRLQDMSKSSRLKTLLASFGLALLLQFLAGMFHLHNTLINPLISLISVALFFMGILQIIYMVRADTAVKKVPEPVRKDLPKKPVSQPQAHPEYTKRLDLLKRLSTEMASRQNSISGFLQDYFNNSTISIARYQSVMNDAAGVLNNNYEKACLAVSMFGNASPTADRLRILDGYVKDSSDTVSRMETIIDELIKIQQQRSFEDYKHLDEMLDSLASSTSAYR